MRLHWVKAEKQKLRRVCHSYRSTHSKPKQLRRWKAHYFDLKPPRQEWQADFVHSQLNLQYVLAFRALPLIAWQQHWDRQKQMRRKRFDLLLQPRVGRLQAQPNLRSQGEAESIRML